MSECVRAYLHGAEYSTQALEDMEPRVRERDSWMQAVGVFCNRGVAPALRSPGARQSIQTRPASLGRPRKPGHELLRPGQRGDSKAATRQALTTACSYSIGASLPNDGSVSVIFDDSIARDTAAEKKQYVEETAAELITYWPRSLARDNRTSIVARERGHVLGAHKPLLQRVSIRNVILVENRKGRLRELGPIPVPEGLRGVVEYLSAHDVGRKERVATGVLGIKELVVGRLAPVGLLRKVLVNLVKEELHVVEHATVDIRSNGRRTPEGSSHVARNVYPAGIEDDEPVALLAVPDFRFLAGATLEAEERMAIGQLVHERVRHEEPHVVEVVLTDVVATGAS